MTDALRDRLGGEGRTTSARAGFGLFVLTSTPSIAPAEAALDAWPLSGVKWSQVLTAGRRLPYGCVLGDWQRS